MTLTEAHQYLTWKLQSNLKLTFYHRILHIKLSLICQRWVDVKGLFFSCSLFPPNVLRLKDVSRNNVTLTEKKNSIHHLTGKHFYQKVSISFVIEITCACCVILYHKPLSWLTKGRDNLDNMEKKKKETANIGAVEPVRENSVTLQLTVHKPMVIAV